MKRILLGTSALVGVALFASQASAQITVRLGGFVNFEAGFLSDDIFDSIGEIGDDDEDTEDGFDFRNDTEVHIRADGKADNGLLYGTKIEIDASGTSLNYDEANLYVAGGWGRLEMGDEDGASDTLTVFAPVVGIGQVDGDFADFGAPDVLIKPVDSGDSTKLTYYTPRIAGFQAGVSYAPQIDDGGDSVVLNGLDDEDAGGGLYDDVVELGVSYATDIAGFSVAAGGGWTFASAKETTDLLGNPIDEEDLNSWGGGVQVGFGGFTVGGGYIRADLTGEDADGWNAGASYENGPWGVAVQYSDYDTGGLASADASLISGGATYTLAPGLTVSGDLGWYDVEQVGEDNEGWVGILSTRVAF
jgi:outer membrane protein OmpU